MEPLDETPLMSDFSSEVEMLGYLDATSRFGKANGFFYNNYYDFIRKEGVYMRGSPLPDHVERGEPRQCYMNAFWLALENGFDYYEGLASLIIPTEHAWCVHEGKVVDPTWPESERAGYYGVHFPIDYVAKVVNDTQYYGVLGNQHHYGFKLFKEKFQFEKLREIL